MTQSTANPEPEIIQLIRKGEAQKAFGMLVSGRAHIGDKSKDGVSAYELAMQIGDDAMREKFRAHLICG